MRKVLKWIGIAVGGAVILLLLIAAGLIVSSDLRFNRLYAIQAEVVMLPSDAASLDVGKRWAEIHCQCIDRSTEVCSNNMY